MKFSLHELYYFIPLIMFFVDSYMGLWRSQYYECNPLRIYKPTCKLLENVQPQMGVRTKYYSLLLKTRAATDIAQIIK